MYARPETRDSDFDRLIACSYGIAPEAPRTAGGPSVTMTTDTGSDVIPQPGVAPAPDDFVEYVVDRPPLPPPTAPPAPVPATPALDISTPAPAPVSPPVTSPPDASARAVSPPAVSPPTAPTDPAPAPAGPMPAPTQQPPTLLSPAAEQQAPGVPAALAASSLTSADLAADMHAILSGHRPDGVPLVDPGRPLPEAAPEQSIFDRISASMEYANSFDLGTVDLQRRFDTLARVDAARREPVGARAMTDESVPAPPRGAPSAAPGAALADPIASAIPAADFEAVYHLEGPWTPLPNRTAGCSGASSLSLTVVDPDRSWAMFDTGEHVLSGGDLYPDQLAINGVSFSYGQLISMGDFYDTADQLLAGDHAELNRLKVLIDRSAQFYRGHRATPSLNVTNAEWNAATGGRYLRLAEENYAHFSPPSELGISDATTRADNRSTWQANHERALHEMQQLVLANPSATPLPVLPMTINAFGDHFLTDAFAAGHLVNKEVVLNRFRATFFTGSDLNEAGKQFFGQVAQKAWHGRVAEQFGQLETESYPLCAWGWCVPWRPNIDSASRFASLLQQAAEAEPVKIGNVALKALHDQLNSGGVEVSNAAGAGTWTLTGDSHLNDATLTVMRRAVQQSVDNVNDPSILVDNLNVSPFFDRVWRHVPTPTAAGRQRVIQALSTYTDPASTTLQDAAADIIGQQLDSMIQVLLDSGKLRRA